MSCTPPKFYMRGTDYGILLATAAGMVLAILGMIFTLSVFAPKANAASVFAFSSSNECPFPKSQNYQQCSVRSHR